MNYLKYLKSHQIYRDFQDKPAKVEDMAHTANNLKLNKKPKSGINQKKWKKKSKKKKQNYKIIDKNKSKERGGRQRKESRKLVSKIKEFKIKKINKEIFI